MRALLVLLILVVAGCELPSEPELRNPYDPKFNEGMPTPTSPGAIRIESSEASSVKLAWDDRSSFETGYVIQRAAAPDVAFITVGSVPGNVLSFTDTTVSFTESYYYRVISVNGTKPSESSDTLLASFDGRLQKDVRFPPTYLWDLELDISPSGTRLVLGGMEGILFNTVDLSVVRTITGVRAALNSLTFNLQGDLFADTDRGRLSLWRAEDGLLVNRLDYPGEAEDPYAPPTASKPGFHPNGQEVGFAWKGSELRIWNWAQAKLSAWSGTAGRQYRAVAFNATGSSMIAADGESIEFWDPVSFTLTGSSNLGGVGTPGTPHFTPDGRFVAFWNSAGFSIWQTLPQKLVKSFLKSSHQFDFSSDGAYALLSGAGVLEIYETATGKLVRRATWPEYFDAAALGPGARSIAITNDAPVGVVGERRIVFFDLTKRWIGTLPHLPRPKAA